MYSEYSTLHRSVEVNRSVPNKAIGAIEAGLFGVALSRTPVVS